MNFVYPIASLITYLLIYAGVKYAVIFYIGGVLTLINMIILYYFDDTPILQQEDQTNLNT